MAHRPGLNLSYLQRAGFKFLRSPVTMFLLQIAQAPVIVQLGEAGVVYSVPKFTLRDIVAWGAAIAAAESDRITKGMKPDQRTQYLMAYPPVPPTVYDLKQRAQTVEGIDHIIRTCFVRATPTLTKAQIDSVLAQGSPGALGFVAWQLADLVDASTVQTPDMKAANAATEAEENPSQDSPLTD